MNKKVPAPAIFCSVWCNFRPYLTSPTATLFSTPTTRFLVLAFLALTPLGLAAAQRDYPTTDPARVVEGIEDMKCVGGELSVDLLCACLGHKDPNMRLRAASALGRKRDVRAVEPLITCLNDPLPAVGVRAAEALAQIGDRRAIDPLVACLKSDSQIAKAAARALARFGYVPQNAQDRVQYFLALEQWDKLAALGAPVVEPLIQCLETNPNADRQRILELLVKLGEPRATDTLVHCLQNDPGAGCRAAAAQGLGAFGDTRALIPLIVALDHPDVNVRDAAVLALGKLGARLGNKRPCTALIACLRESEPRVRASAAESLGLLGDPTAIQPLLTRMSDTSALVRDRANNSFADVPSNLTPSGKHRNPHMEKGTAAGGNAFYLDGHAKWTKATLLKRRYDPNRDRVYWWW